jgi:signal transduction histidine kinase
MDAATYSPPLDSRPTRARAWGKDRVGLVAIFASLAVIALVFGLLLKHLQEKQVERIRAQGLSLVRLLASMPLAQLVPGDGRQGVLQVIRQSRNDPDFAYAAVVDAQGRPLAAETAAGILVPPAALPTAPTAWLGERPLSLPNRGRDVLEFHAPLLRQGELAGYVRLGYFQPEWGISSEQLSFFATLALPIFLLSGLFYLLLRREVRPLHKASRELEELVRQGSFHQVSIEASGELGDFMRRFNAFLGQAQGRIHELEEEQSGLRTSAKLLSYKRDRIEAMLQSLPEALLVLDESGAVSYANARVEPMLGLDPARILGHPPRDWSTIPEIIAFLSRYEAGSSAGYGSDGLEFPLPGVPERHMALNAYPLFSPREPNRVFGTLLAFRDITAEHAAKQSRAEFVAHVAHELKTPLNVLAMYSESLQGEDGKSEAFRIEAVNVIQDEVERLSMLINNLLSITKIEMGSMDLVRQRVKLRDLLEDAFNTVSRNARAQDIRLSLELPQDLSPISVDKDLLRIAINNLLTNAIKYNRPGGSVTLSAEENDDSIAIHVRDTGIGIGQEEQSRVFDKFYRSMDDQVRARSGHGLGLALARDIVQLHHGSLSVKSALGEGTEFTIEIDKGQVFLAGSGA